MLVDGRVRFGFEHELIKTYEVSMDIILYSFYTLTTSLAWSSLRCNSKTR